MFLLAAPGVPLASLAEAPFDAPAFWRSISWAEVERHPAFAALKEVREYDPAKDRIVESRPYRAGSMRFGGHQLDVELLEKESEVPFRKGIRFKAVEDLDGSKARSFYTRLLSGLGPPTVANDFSWPGKDGRKNDAVIIQAQWEIGDSRLELQCTTFDFMSPKVIGWCVAFAFHKGTQEMVKRPTWIRCTQTMKYNFVGVARPAESREDRVFVIDDSPPGRLLDPSDFRPVGNTGIFSEAEITLDNQSKERSDTIRINRTTGQYSEIRVIHAMSGEARITGQCAKFDPAGTRF